MTIARRFGLGLLLAVGVLALPSMSEARRVAPPRCPRAEARDGTPCRHVAMTCSWRGRDEGDRDRMCTCVLGADDARTWHCESVGVVYRD